MSLLLFCQTTYENERNEIRNEKKGVNLPFLSCICRHQNSIPFQKPHRHISDSDHQPPDMFHQKNSKIRQIQYFRSSSEKLWNKKWKENKTLLNIIHFLGNVRKNKFILVSTTVPPSTGQLGNRVDRERNSTNEKKEKGKWNRVSSTSQIYPPLHEHNFNFNTKSKKEKRNNENIEIFIENFPSTRKIVKLKMLVEEEIPVQEQKKRDKAKFRRRGRLRMGEGGGG